MPKVRSYKPIGKQQTYDLEVNHPDHQYYLANGTLTSNSHAVSYAIDSYYCAWLMTYYEEEWLCAYLEAMSNSIDRRKKAFSEIKKLGYTVEPIDINYASDSWTILPGKKFMPSFSSCKGVGSSAIEEIVRMRPFDDFESIFWDENGKWRLSKFNKRALKSLIKIRAFNSLDVVGEGKLFSSYRAMYEIMVEHLGEIRRSLKRDPFEGRNRFRELVVEYSGMEEWPKKVLAEYSKELLGSFKASDLVSPELMEGLRERKVKSVDDYDGNDIYWFIVANVKKKTTKNGKPYLLITAAGEDGGQITMFCWGWDGETELPEFAVCAGEIDKNNFGYSTKWWRLKILDN